MKKISASAKLVAAHYDAAVEDWKAQYDPKRRGDTTAEYPANQFRLKLLLNSFKKNRIKKVFEVGFGAGTPLIELSKKGFDVMGLDIAPKMVEAAKENFTVHGLDPDRVFWGDIQHPESFGPNLRGKGTFDGLLAMGVMPHVENEAEVIRNMAKLLKPGGSVFIEFRNSLFSLFTQNRYTTAFILEDLLKGVDPRMKKIVADDLEKRMRMDMPPVRKHAPDSGTGPGYDMILAKFHNPFEVVPLFERLGFTDIQLLWYHYHPAMPYLEKKHPKLFRNEAMKLEGEKSDWRGYFLCSAFVVEAKRGK